MKFYKNKLIYVCLTKGEFWIRFNFLKKFKYDGFRVKDLRKNQLIFSERIGKTKTINILNYNLKLLNPYKL
jgi:hypothetical protein